MAPSNVMRGLHHLLSYAVVALLALPYAVVLAGVFLLGRWDAVLHRVTASAAQRGSDAV